MNESGKKFGEKGVVNRSKRRDNAKFGESSDSERKLKELKSRFIAMVSHEFRTPLSTILSSAELIEMYSDQGQQEKRVRSIRRIKDAVAMMTDILNDFLLLNRLDKEDILIHPVEFEVSEFFKVLLDEIRGMLKAGQKYCYFHEGSLVSIAMDKQCLKNIIFNLMSNACKYSDPDGKIVCRTSVEGGYLNIEVEDFGLGIPSEDRPYLFERFFRAHNVESIQGTGLGLNIVKKYVDLLGGRIWFVSKLGSGSTFYVTIPFLTRD